MEKSDKYKLQQRVNDSKSYALIYESEEFKSVMKDVEARLTRQWKESGTPEEREEIFFTLQGALRFATEFRSKVEDGVVAAKQLAKIRQGDIDG